MSKKSILVLLMTLVLALSLMVFFACDKGTATVPGGDNEEGGPGEYEDATYTVTYDPNGGLKSEEWASRQVAFGDKVPKPTYTPIKSGYTFAYWSISKSGTEYDFANSSVDGDLTLYAVYGSKVFTHDFELSAVLKKDENGYSVSLGEYLDYENLPDGTKLETYYNSSSTSLRCPKTTRANDYFLFWYYLDDNNQPVQLSVVASAGADEVGLLKAYTLNKKLTLYPMWRSTAFDIDVVFKDTIVKDNVYSTMHVKYGETILKIDDPIQYDGKEGTYEFVRWYYIDNNKKVPFVLDDGNESATIISTAAGVDSYFKTGSITVYAEWRLKIAISTVAGYKNFYDELRDENTTEERLEQLLNAHIELVGEFDFAGYALGMLFEKDHPFHGIIDGATYDTNKNVVSKAVFNNIEIEGKDYLSIFGYVSGSILNLDVNEITYTIKQNSESQYENLVHIASIASVLTTIDEDNPATIRNCDYNQTNIIVNYLGINNVSIGGIVTTNNGAIESCSVHIDSVDIDAKSVMFGGIATENLPTSTTLITTVDVTLSIVASKDAKVGGVAAINSSTIAKTEVALTLNKFEADGEIFFGGIAGSNVGTVNKAKSSLNFVDKINVNANSQIGGIVGRNEGIVENSYLFGDINVQVNTSSKVYVGGLVGNNNAVSTASSAGQITYCYVVGNITVDVLDGQTANIYAAAVTGNNTQTNVKYLYTDTNTIVNNKNGISSLGFMIGNMGSNAVVSNIYYSTDSKISLNDTYYDAEVEDMFSICDKGTLTQTENIKASDWLIGTKSILTFSADIWEIIEEGVSYPSLI